RLARLFECLFEAFVDLEDFAVDVVVAHADAHGISGDGHALDHDVRVEAQDVTVFESTWLAFVGVAYQVLLTGQVARHEAPFEAGRKARTATSTQARSLDFGNDVLRLHAGGEYLAQCLVATARDIVLQAPVIAVEVGHDLGIDVPAMKDHAARQVSVGSRFEPLRKPAEYFRSVHADSPCRLSSSIMASIFSGAMRTHMCLSFTSSTGESPQEPMHSPSIRVNRPSSVVSWKPTPSFWLRYSAV